MSYFSTNYGFTVRVPSHSYLNRTEGLCGSCNGNTDDDWTKPDGSLADDADQFGLAWLVKSLLDRPLDAIPAAAAADDVCQAIPQKECDLLPPSEDPCFKLIDSPVFQVDLFIDSSILPPFLFEFVPVKFIS